jgi:hypothetical protein
VPGLRFELRDEDGLEQEVAELLAERRVIVAVDGLEHLVGFLEHEGLQGVDRLLPIPRAAIGRAERRDDLHKTGELLRSA